MGTGNFGVVREAIWKTPSNEKVNNYSIINIFSAKIIQKKTRLMSKVNVAVKTLNDSMLAETTFNDLLSEVSCMCNIRHKNLIKLYGIVLSTGKQRNIIMVTELAPLGSLLNHVQTNANRLLINIMHSYFQQISSGLEYLEAKKLIHRDLAARNILLFTTDSVNS